MKKIIQLLAAILGPSTLLGCTSTPGPITALEIRNVLNNFADAAEQGDVELIGSWVQEDVYHWGLESGRIHEGKQELMEALAEDTSAGSDFAENISPELVSFRRISPDVVVVDLVMNYNNHQDKHGQKYAKFVEPTVVIFNRRGGEWKIASVYAAGNRAETYRSDQ